MRRTLRDLLLVSLLPVFALAGATALRISAYSAVKPHGQTFREHLETMPEPVEYHLLGAGDGKHLVVHGPMPATWAFASGPPMYVFDRAGRLVDHTIDSGDDNRFRSRWSGVYSGDRLSRAEAEAWVIPQP